MTAQRAQIMTRSAVFFPLCETKPMFFGVRLVQIESEQDVKHRGRACGFYYFFPSVKRKAAYFHTMLELNQEIHQQQWHVTSSQGLSFRDWTGLITSVLICYWLFSTRTSRWCKSKPLWTCLSFNIQKKNKHNNRKPPSQAVVLPCLGKDLITFTNNTKKMLLKLKRPYSELSSEVQV